MGQEQIIQQVPFNTFDVDTIVCCYHSIIQALLIVFLDLGSFELKICYGSVNSLILLTKLTQQVATIYSL